MSELEAPSLAGSVNTPTDLPEPALQGAALAGAASLLLAACGGGGNTAEEDPTVSALAVPGVGTRPSRRDCARFLTQATFGPTGAAQIDALAIQGFVSREGSV